MISNTAPVFSTTPLKPVAAKSRMHDRKVGHDTQNDMHQTQSELKLKANSNSKQAQTQNKLELELERKNLIMSVHRASRPHPDLCSPVAQ